VRVKEVHNMVDQSGRFNGPDVLGCIMLKYWEGFMHACFVSSLLDVCEEGGAEWMGRWGKFITVLLA